MRFAIALALATTVLVLAPSTWAEEKKPTPAEQRASIDKMREETLAQLYKVQPDAKAKIAKAPGYAVFSEYGLTVLFVGGAGGKGVAVNNATGHKTYMNMGQVSAGLGLGGKELRTVFVFKTKQAFDDFVNKGWEFGGGGAGVAQAGSKGGGEAGHEVIGKAMDVYQLTKNGLIAEVTVSGTKYWKDAALN
ncbi:MAG TPA: YSC84-related protein [Pelomicrobium sp.]|nr:YSC84-related protein [Pelomicrobium sp.]